LEREVDGRGEKWGGCKKGKRLDGRALRRDPGKIADLEDTTSARKVKKYLIPRHANTGY